MPPKTPPERHIGTHFTHGDQLDFHAASPEIKTLEDLEREALMSYEATPVNRTAARVDGATVISLAERRVETVSEPLDKVQEVGVSSKNIQTMRAYRLSQEAGQPTGGATILPFVRRRSPKTTSDTQDLDSQAA